MAIADEYKLQRFAQTPGLMDENLHLPHRWLIELRIEHADLNNLIDRHIVQGVDDELSLRRLKKRRLALRDQIATLERQLEPQRPA